MTCTQLPIHSSKPLNASCIKLAICWLLVGLPLFVFGQSVDTLAITGKVDSLLKISNALLGKGDFTNAQVATDQAAQIASETLGETSLSYGSCCNLYGLLSFAKGNYPDAEQWYLKAQSIRKSGLGTDHPDYLGVLINLAVVSQKRGQYEKAASLFLEAKETFEIKKQHLDHPFYQNCLANLADLYTLTGEYDKSEPLHLKALAIREKTLGKEHPKYAKSLTNLAVLYIKMGLYEKAEPLLLESLLIKEKVLGIQHPEYAFSLSGLSNLYYSMGNYEKAEPYFLQVRRMRLKLLGNDHPDYAISLTNLAGLYWSMGNYEKTEPLLLEALGIYEKKFGPKHPEYAGVLNNLAGLYFDMGNYKRAESFYLETEAIWKNVLGVEHPNYAKCLNNLASLYSTTGFPEKAESFRLESLSIREKVLGKEHPDYAGALNSLADLYLNMGQQEKALPLYLESISIQERVLGKEHPNYARSLDDLAALYLDMGELEKSRPLLLESLALCEKVLGKAHPDYAESLSHLASWYRSTKAYDQAEPLLTELTLYYQTQMITAASYLSEGELNSYLKTFSAALDQVYSFNHQFKSKTSIVSSFDNTLFYKGFLLSVTHQIKQLVSTDAVAAEKFNRLTALNRRLAAEYALPIAERSHVSELEAKANDIEKDLARSVSGYENRRRQVSWHEIQQQLAPGSAAIEFISFQYGTPKSTDSTMYAALILLPGDTAPHYVPLFEQRQLQALCDRPGLDPTLVLKDLYGNSPSLCRLLWNPIEPLLRDATTIYYAPTGLLHRINPAALLDETGQSLSEHRQWVRVGSTRALVTDKLADQSFAHSMDKNATPTAMVLGGITYDMDSTAFVAANPYGAVDSIGGIGSNSAFHYVISEQNNDKPTAIRGRAEGGWEALASTGREAEEVAAMLRKSGFNTIFKHGLYASEEQIKQLGIRTASPSILHLATHGFSFPDPGKNPSKGFISSETPYKLLDDPMFRSGLLLAGANYYWKNKRPLTHREDGVLVAYEVRDLHLQNTELAVLSACQTGLGDVVGSEGVFGLQRAFRIAGVKFMIVSLWDVPDQQTQELMRLFYQNWLEHKESLREAFNHAQQRLRAKEPSPELWAGFVLIE